jgi:hypothetical protein
MIGDLLCGGRNAFQAAKPPATSSAVKIHRQTNAVFETKWGNTVCSLAW